MPEHLTAVKPEPNKNQGSKTRERQAGLQLVATTPTLQWSGPRGRHTAPVLFPPSKALPPCPPLPGLGSKGIFSSPARKGTDF